jgi:hypothetical protein
MKRMHRSKSVLNNELQILTNPEALITSHNLKNSLNIRAGVLVVTDVLV